MVDIDRIGIIRNDDRKYECLYEKIKKTVRKIFLKVKMEITDECNIIVIPKYKSMNSFMHRWINIQIKRYIKKGNITELLFENDIKMDNKIKFENKLEDKIYIRNNVIQVFKYIFNINKKNINLENIYVLVNEYNKYNINLINQLTEVFKTVNIITENVKRFKRLEDKYYEQGILITVSNNRRKSLRNAKYILNIDFDKNDFLLYNINSCSIIINISNKNIDIRNGFNGILVNNVDIKINKEKDIFINEFYGNINKRLFIEALIKRSVRKLEYIEKINQEYEIKIAKLIGRRGVIENDEFLV